MNSVPISVITWGCMGLAQHQHQLLMVSGESESEQNVLNP